MALKDVINSMNTQLANLTKDLVKATNGNKAASQRVRTGSIKFEKTAKIYRKESVAAEKKGVFKKMKQQAHVAKKPVKKAKPAKKPIKKGRR
ncbi:MAG: histone [Chlamydiota bacterium]